MSRLLRLVVVGDVPEGLELRLHHLALELVAAGAHAFVEAGEVVWREALADERQREYEATTARLELGFVSEMMRKTGGRFGSMREAMKVMLCSHAKADRLLVRAVEAGLVQEIRAAAGTPSAAASARSWVLVEDSP